MPTYEYVCPACGARFETLQRMSDDPLTICQTCGGPIHRVLFPAGIVFKGGGFYSTDHRHDGAAKTDAAKVDGSQTGSGDTAPASTGATETSGGGSASSGESKPAAAPAKD